MPTSKSFRIGSEPWHFDYGIYYRELFHDGTVAFPAKPLEMHAYSRSDLAATAFEPQPIMRVDKDALQQLMDELWRVGIRPSEGAGSAGAMLATQRHLEDMRALVFKTTPVAQIPISP